jgi:hypothetical protein
MRYLLITLLLAGCTTTNTTHLTVVEMKDIHVDNSAKNNFVGNPCKYYVGDYCMLVNKKPTPRNPDNPLKNDR